MENDDDDDKCEEETIISNDLQILFTAYIAHTLTHNVIMYTFIENGNAIIELPQPSSSRPQPPTNRAKSMVRNAVISNHIQVVHGSISHPYDGYQKWLAAFNEIASAWHLKTIGFLCYIGISCEMLNENLLCNTHTTAAKLIFAIAMQVHACALALCRR